MRKLLLFVLSLTLSIASQAQSFVPESGTSDTVTATYTSGTEISLYNRIKSTSATPVSLKWRVMSIDFGTGWDADSSGICDNYSCRYNLNDLYTNGTIERSDPYTTTKGDFHVLFAVSNTTTPPAGSKAVVTVRLTDSAANYTRTLTFIVTKSTVGVGQVNNGNDNISVFPNPARDYVNVLFNKQDKVRTIAVYNLIGKTLRVFVPTDDNSAKLDLDNIPSGVYFLRLMNEAGMVIATRRFTRQ